MIHINDKKINLRKVIQFSTNDISDLTNEFIKSPSIINGMKVFRTAATSGAWIANSSIVNLKNKFVFDEESLNPLELNEIKKSDDHSSNFKNIYNHTEELKLENLKSQDLAIMLIPGVFNEFFSYAPFERSLKYLSRTKGIDYKIVNVSGTYGSKSNSQKIEQEINEYITKNPKKKIWLIGYSKGGLDALYFLNNKSAKKLNIIGLSTIASPVQGHKYLNKRIFKALRKNIKIEPDSKLKKQALELLKEIQFSLSEEKQRRWLFKNKDSLPKDIFYSSLAFESQWYESHVWMILLKALIRSRYKNDGVVESHLAHFPQYIKSLNLGTIKAHHLVGNRSATYNQENLIESILFYLNLKGYIK